MREHLTDPVVEVFGRAANILNLEESIALDEAVNGTTGSSEREYLYELQNQVSRYSNFDENPTVTGFLEWVDLVISSESGGDMPLRPPDKKSVQLITGHGAKGLEWDVVFAVGNSAAEFLNSRSYAGSPETLNLYEIKPDLGWTNKAEKLPYELRKDAEALPKFRFRTAEGKQELVERLEQYATAQGEQDLEDNRRLAYVIYTRARHQLYVSSAIVQGLRGGKRGYPPAPFLLDAASVQPASGGEGGVTIDHLREKFAEGLREREAGATEGTASVEWPWAEGDEVQLRLRGLSNAVSDCLPEGSGDEAGSLAQAALLVAARDAEQYRRENWQEFVALPNRLSASAYTAMRKDYDAWLKGLARRMPQNQNTAGDKGTRFHAWVAQQYGVDATADEDALNVDDLTALIETFTDSQYGWLNLAPLAVEEEINFSWSPGADDDNTTDCEEVAPQQKMFVARIDVIFQAKDVIPDADDDDVLIVDWKTFRKPAVGVVEQMQPQLEVYKQGWLSAHPELTADQVKTAFYFVVSDDLVII
jgi:DNA helicase-2/ATP-dependent DNA helicase PcrA